MKVIGQIIALLFGMALLGTIGFGTYLAIEYAIALFSSLDRQVAIVTGIACLVALAVSQVIARAIRAANPQDKAMALRDEKTATCQLFVDCWENLLRQGRARTDPLPADLSDKLKVLDRLLALYGGAAVVKAHTALRDLERDKGAQHPDVRARFGEALLAIRKDLGADAPRHFGIELERLLVPARDADNGVGESRDARSPKMLAPTA